MPASQNYERIQILRFIAALAVVLFHAIGTAGRYFQKPSSFEIGKHGDYGVDLFFVISGFIMFLTVSTSEPDWRLFLVRRLERIIPLYWLASATMIVMLAIPGISSTPPPDIAYIVRSLTFLSWTADRLPIVYPGWTIEFEMFFYLLITAFLAVTTRPWIATLMVLSACVLTGVVARAQGLDFPAVKFFGSPLLLEFGLGIIVGYVVVRKAVPPLAIAVIVIALAVVAAGPWNEAVFRLFVAGLPSALIVLAATSLDERWPLRSTFWQVFVKLGNASYAIYLVQIFVISIGCKILQRLIPGASINVPIVMTTVAAVMIAWLIHIYVERPLGRHLRRNKRTLAH